MVTIVRDRIKEMVSRGMTLEQVKAAQPTLDYDGRYGSRPARGPPTCSSRRSIGISAGRDSCPAGSPSRSRWSRSRCRQTARRRLVGRSGAGHAGDAEPRRRSIRPAAGCRWSANWAWRMVTPRKQFLEPAAERRGPPGRQPAGSGARSERHAMPIVRRRPHHARAWASARDVGERHDAEDRDRRRSADRMLRFGGSAAPGVEADWQGQSVAAWDVAGGPASAAAARAAAAAAA